MKFWDSLKKFHDQVFLWLLPKEILLKFGSEERILAQTFSMFSMLCFLCGSPIVFYITFKFQEIVGLYLILPFIICFLVPFVALLL